MEKHLNVGDVLLSNNYGMFRVVEIKNCNNATIEFLATKNLESSRVADIKRGNVKDYYSESIFNVGVVGKKYKTRKDKKILKEYVTWINMLKRCYDEKLHDKNKTYMKCEVSDNFKHYENFYEWCNKQIGFNNSSWHLDKDLLIKGNKVYSEDTCVFLPQEINKALIKADKIRGDLPIGVYAHKKANKYMAQICNGNRNQRYLGLFDTELEAFNAYKTAKEAYLRELSERYKHQIDPRAYEALMNYEVEIDD